MERLETRRAELDREGARLAAISVDAVADCRSLAADLGVGFPLLADEKGAVARAYGVWHAEKEIALPALVVVDRAGTIRWRRVSRSVDDRPPEDDVVDVVRRVGR